MKECHFYTDMIGTTGDSFRVWLGYLPYAPWKPWERWKFGGLEVLTREDVGVTVPIMEHKLITRDI